MEKILVVDDDSGLCQALSEELSETGYEVRYAVSADDALKSLEIFPADLILLDLKMPEKDGFFVLKYLHQIGHTAKIIVLTAFADVKSAVEAAKLGAGDFVSKPYDFDELLLTIRQVLNRD